MGPCMCYQTWVPERCRERHSRPGYREENDQLWKQTGKLNSGEHGLDQNSPGRHYRRGLGIWRVASLAIRTQVSKPGPPVSVAKSGPQNNPQFGISQDTFEYGDDKVSA